MVAWKLESFLVLSAIVTFGTSHAAHLRSLSLIQDLLENAIDALTDDDTGSSEPSVSPTTTIPTALPTTPPMDPILLESLVPLQQPSGVPSFIPSTVPSDHPSDTGFGTVLPDETFSTDAPSGVPSSVPTNVPTVQPPSATPSIAPSTIPSLAPSAFPSSVPSDVPSQEPSMVPSSVPTLLVVPDSSSILESLVPSAIPSSVPSDVPSVAPSMVPSSIPSDVLSAQPSLLVVPDSSNIQESLVPSAIPSSVPSDVPSVAPSTVPSSIPSDVLSAQPSLLVVPDSSSILESLVPSAIPSSVPSDVPSLAPSRVPSSIPSDVVSAQPSLLVVPDSSSILESFVPSSIPSNLQSDVPSDLSSDLSSMVPSNLQSNVPSDVSSDLSSMVPSNVQSNPSSDVPTSGDLSTLVPTVLSAEDVGILETTCTQFLEDFLPLVQPNDYSDLDCTLVDATKESSSSNPSLRRRLTLQEVLVPFSTTNDMDLLLAVTGDVPDDGTDFSQVVAKTFETFGEEFQNSLNEASPAFSGDGNQATPIIPEDEVPNRSPSSDGFPMDWVILGSAIAGGVCLALIVSFFIIKRIKHPTQQALPNSMSKDLSKSDSQAASFRGTPAIKMVTVEASPSLQQQDEEMVMPPTPFGIDIPNNLFNSPAEIASEISPSSVFGDCPCSGNMRQTDTFDGLDATIGENDVTVDGHTTFNTGMTSFGATTTNDDFGERMSREQLSTDSSELEGLRLVTSNTNGNVASSILESKNGIEQEFIPFSTGRRGFFSFLRLSSLRKRSSPDLQDSGDVQDCCAQDSNSWTIRTNSLLTPRKANTTSSANLKQSTSF